MRIRPYNNNDANNFIDARYFEKSFLLASTSFRALGENSRAAALRAEAYIR